MGDGPNDPKPLEVPLTGHRRVLLDVDGADWRVAFYYPKAYPSKGPHPKIVAHEKRARAGDERDRSALRRLEIGRKPARAPSLRVALTRAMTLEQTNRYGAPEVVEPSLAEVEQIARYVLDGRYAEQVGRAS